MIRFVTMASLLASVSLAAASLASAQIINIDELPESEPVFIPVPSQNRDDDSGSIFREVQPVPLPGGNDAGGGGFIDRAFGTGQAEALPRDGGFSPEWFEEDGEERAEDGDETEIGRRRFKEAPARTSRLFGPNRPVPIADVQTVPATAGALRRLDKMTGVTETLELKAGEEVGMGRLRVALDECRMPAGGTGRGTMAHLRIWDAQVSESEPVFAGWMFAESPALSAMDHPRYDVWVLRCEDATAEVGGQEEQG